LASSHARTPYLSLQHPDPRARHRAVPRRQARPGALSLSGRPQSRDFFTQLLFSYKINPQTVFYLGYSDSSFGDDRIDLLRADRTLFLKIGYAWLL
jgi:hypothetical protein